MPDALDRSRGWLEERNARWGIAALIALVFLLYYPGAKGPFMLDDFSNLLGNRHIQITELTLTQLWDAAFSTKSGALRRPVAMASFALNHYFAGGVESFPIKLVNVVLHVLTAALLFFLTRHLLARLTRIRAGPHVSGSLSIGWTALLITGLWALHPLHVSTVLYAVQRMTELAALFTVLGALLYVQGREQLLAGRSQAGSVRIGLGLAACGLLATLSKENGALLPVLLLAVELVFYRFDVGHRTPRIIRAGLMLLLVIPAAAIAGYLIYVWASPLGLNPARDFDATERLLTESRVLFFYLGQLFVPDLGRMSLFHGGIEVSRGLLQPPSTLFAVMGVLLLAGGALYGLYRRRFPVLVFAVLWFLGGHLLESTVIPLELVFEHRNYLPSYGPLFAVGYALTQTALLGRLRLHVRYALLAAVLLALAGPLQLRVSYWSNISDFLIYELVSHPDSPRAWVSLAYAEAQRGLYKDAAKFYRKAGELEPPEAGHLVGALSLDLHELKQPIDEDLLDEILARLEHHPVTVYTAGQLYRMGTRFRGESERDSAGLAVAIRVFARAAANTRWPTVDHRAAAYFLLGELLLYQREPLKAVQALRGGLVVKPEEAHVRVQLAELLVRLDQPDAARREILLVDADVLSAADRARLEQLQEELVAPGAGTGAISGGA